MTRRLPSFSSLDRASLCRASTVLPAADSITEDATSGTVMHAFLLRVAALRAEGASPEDAAQAAALEAPEEEQEFLTSIPVENLPTDPSAFAGEVALAFDAATGQARELGRDIGRRYEEAALAQGKPLSPTEFVGSSDVMALMGSDGVYNGDFKKRGRYVKPARANWQIKAGLVAACRAWGRQRGRGEVIRIFEDGRPPFRDHADFGPADIEAAQVELTRLAIRIIQDRKAHAQGEEIPAVTGSHCRYCASFQWCPANGTLARRLGSEPEMVKGELVALITRENAPGVRRRIVQARAVIDAAEHALDELASQEAAAGRPLVLEPGLFYAPVPRPREVIDGAQAEALLRSELGEAAGLALEIDVTKAGLKKAIRAKLNGARGVTKAEAELLEKLRRAGAVKKTVSYSCDEVREKSQPRQAELPPANEEAA